MSTTGGVHRGVIPTDHFTIIENATIRDERLSYKARGLLALLLSHEPGWVVMLTDLVTPIDGLASVRSGIRELEALEYLRRSRVRLPSGAYGPDRWDIGQPVDSHMRKSNVA